MPTHYNLAAFTIEQSSFSDDGTTTLARGVMMAAAVGAFELMVVLFDSAPIQVTLIKCQGSATVRRMHGE